MDSLQNTGESRATKIVYVPINRNENVFKPVLVYCEANEASSLCTIKNR